MIADTFCLVCVCVTHTLLRLPHTQTYVHSERSPAGPAGAADSGWYLMKLSVSPCVFHLGIGCEHMSKKCVNAGILVAASGW